MLPRKFSKQFSKAGLDIEKFKEPLTFFEHRAAGNGVHAGSAEESWNGVWKEFFSKNPNANAQQILNKLGQMRSDFGI